MPINPSIALNIKPVQLANPLEQYTNMLQARTLMNQDAEYQHKVAARNALSKFYQPDTGSYDYEGMAKGGFGDLISDTKKAEAEQQKAALEQQKAHLELVGSAFKNSGQMIAQVQTPEQMKAYNAAIYSDPVMGPIASKFGTLQQEDAEVDQAVKSGQFAQYLQGKQKAHLSLEQQLESQIVTINRGGDIVTRRMSKNGTFPTTTVSVDKVTKSPNPTGTTITIDQKGEGAGAVKWGELEAQGLHDLKKSAMGAPQLVKDADRALDILENNKAYTGAFANQQLGLAQTLKAMGVPVEGVTETQQLSALLGKKVLSAIQTSGLGSRGVDTPKEREFLEKAENGQITLDRDTLITAAKLMRKSAQYMVQNYNENARHAPASWFKATGGQRTLPTIPDREAPRIGMMTFDSMSSKDRADAIEELRQHPEAAGEFDAHFGPGASARVLGR